MSADRVHTGALQLLGAQGKCPICGEPPRGNVWVCPACSAFHHQECRDYAGGCSTYGCRLAAPPPPDAVPKKLPHKGRAISLLTLVAGLMVASTLIAVGSLVQAFLHERAEEERLRASQGPAIRFEGKDIETILGNLNISVDVRDESGNISVRLNGEKPTSVTTASFDALGVKARLFVVSP